MSDLLLELLLDVVSVDVVRVEVSEDQELVSEESVVPLEVDAAAELELVVESRRRQRLSCGCVLVQDIP